MSDLPPGFVLEQPQGRSKRPTTYGDLPPGFVIEKRATPEGQPVSPENDVGFSRGFQHPEERIPSTAGLLPALGQYAGHVLGGIEGMAEKGGRAATGAGPMPTPLEAFGMASMGVVPRGLPINPAAIPTARQGVGAILRDVRGGPEPPLPASGGRVQPVTPATPAVRPQLPQPAGGIPGRPAPGVAPPPGGVSGPPVLQPPFSRPAPQPARPTTTQGIPGKPEPGRPAPAGGFEEALVSPLGKAIATNDAGAADRALVRAFRRTIKPVKGRQRDLTGYNAVDQQIVTSTDKIIQNSPNLRLDSQPGVLNPRPTSLYDYAQALDQTMRRTFQQYNDKLRAAGMAGATVDLAPVSAELRRIAGSKVVQDFHPEIMNEAERVAANLERRGTLSLEEAQDYVENINSMLKPFWRNPDWNAVSKSSILAPASRVLRQQINNAVTQFRGPGWQQLRNEYGALKDTMTHVANAVQAHAKRLPGGIGGIFADIGANYELLHGIMSLSPESIARAGGLRAAKAAYKYLNDPNRAIRLMFARRTAPAIPPGLSSLVPLAALPFANAGANLGQPMPAMSRPMPPPPQPMMPPQPPARPRYRTDDYIEPPPLRPSVTGP